MQVAMFVNGMPLAIGFAVWIMLALTEITLYVMLAIKIFQTLPANRKSIKKLLPV